LAFVLTGGERAEAPVLPALLAAGRVRRGGPGRPRCRPKRLVADRGYSFASVRALLRRRGIAAVIPTRRDQRPLRSVDRDAYRARNLVERCVNRLKQFRRVASRFEKTAASDAAMLTLAAILRWL
jgi:transposase